LATFQRLLLLQCTPRLRRLHIYSLQPDGPAAAPFSPDLRRLDYVRLKDQDTQSYKVFKSIGIHQVPKIHYSLDLNLGIYSRHNFELVAGLDVPLHIQLHDLPRYLMHPGKTMHEYDLRHEEILFRSLALYISQGRAASLSVPHTFDKTARFRRPWLRALCFLLLKACHDAGTPVVLQQKCDDTYDFSPAFERYLASSADAGLRQRLLE
jgi:hypothetical protein